MKIGDTVFVSFSGSDPSPAIVTAVRDGGVIEATVFAPGTISYYSGPAYASRREADRKADGHPHRAYTSPDAPRKTAKADDPTEPEPAE